MIKLLEIVIIIFLIIAYYLLVDYHTYYLIIYIFLVFFSIYKLFLIFKHNKNKLTFKIIFILISIYPASYILICDPNPLYYALTFYLPFQNFFRGLFTIIAITFTISIVLPDEFSEYKILSEQINNNDENIESYTEDTNLDNIELKNQSNKEDSDIVNSINKNDNEKNDENEENDKNNLISKNKNYKYSFFLSNLIFYLKDNKFKLFVILIILTLINISLTFYRIKFWIYFKKKEEVLPIGTSKNTTYYLTGMIAFAETIIEDWIIEMKKVINFLGEENVMVSVVENGDSKDKTRDYLIKFKEYLDNKKIRNKFLFEHVVDDPRKIIKEMSKEDKEYYRIVFYAELRNRVFDLLYETKDIDYNNTRIIYFNDIIFTYQDIIKLIATNNEDYDAVCALDFDKIYFYDTWVTYDLNGNCFRDGYPFSINSESQEQLINLKPIRIFSCWNGAIVFTAAPLENKKLQFRVENNTKIIKYPLNGYQRYPYESECTYLHIDMETMGYTKRLINPDVKVAYKYNVYYLQKYFFHWTFNIFNYFYFYFYRFTEPRNKYMSNLKDKSVRLGFGSKLERWYNIKK